MKVEKPTTHRAVVLAAGLGTRMRRGSEEADLSGQNRDAARQGLKGLIRLNGRPFLDFQIQRLIEAGCTEICLVLAAGRSALHDRYEHLAERLRAERSGIRLAFATQHEPKGTADALLAAEEFTAGDDFLLLNSDNLYPLDALRRLIAAGAPAVVAFDRSGIARSNIAPERIAEMAIVTGFESGALTDIIEKPGEAERTRFPDAPLSMNCWHFPARIFDACREIEPHPERGELEIPTAVLHAIRTLDQTFALLRSDEPVFDMTGVRDIPALEEATRDIRLTLPEIEG